MQIAWSASLQIRRVAVGLAEDGDDFDAQVAAGPDDPQSDFATIGDQECVGT